MYSFEKKYLLDFIGQTAVKALIASEAMIAGGAITSIFTKQPINDVDVYFRSYEHLKRFLSIVYQTDFDLNVSLEDLNEEDKNFQYFEFINPYDLRVCGHTDKSILVQPMTHKQKDGSTINIQLIHFGFCKSPEEIFKSFDFNINMGCFDFKSFDFVLDPSFLIGLAQRQLVVNIKTNFPLISALRIEKYKERGYSISKKEYFKLLLAITQLKLKSWKDVKKHISGFYGTTYDKLFDTTKDFSIEEVCEQLNNIEAVNSQLKLETPDYESEGSLKVLRKKLEQMHNPLYVPQLVFWKFTKKDNTSYYGGNWRDDNYRSLKYKSGEYINGGKQGIYASDETTFKSWSKTAYSNTNWFKCTVKDESQVVYGNSEVRLLGDVFVEQIDKDGNVIE